MSLLGARRLLAAVTGAAAVTALTVVAAPSGTAATASASAVSMAGGFVPVQSTRVLDTRKDLGAPGPVRAQHTVNVPVTGIGSIPATGVVAVVINLTVTNAQRGGFLTAYPSGSARPTTSNVNFFSGETVASLATVRLQSGRISVYAGSGGSVDIVADVEGYYLSGTPTDAGAFAALAPARILDTRLGLGAPKARVAGNAALALTVAGHGNVPASGVSAVVLNVTVTRPGTNGYLTAYPFGSARPRASNINFTVGASVPNQVTVQLGTGGKVLLYNGSGGSTDILADVAGYYLAGTATKAGAFVPIAPTRFVDSRAGQGLSGFVLGGVSFGVQLLALGGTGRDHVGGIPLDNVSSVVINVIAGQASGYVSVYPLGAVREPGSTVNDGASGYRANAAVVRVGFCGQVAFYNGSVGLATLIADASGYFLAADATPTPTPTNTVRAFGRGPLGDGDFHASQAPVTAHGLSDVTTVAAGPLAIRTDGSVATWGSLNVGRDLAETFGQSCSTPVTVPGLSGVVAVASGTGASYALKSDGTVWAWGSNDRGQLGNGTTTASNSPVQVTGLTGVTAIASQDAGTSALVLALKSDGTVWGWGQTFQGELGIGSSIHDTPVQIAPAVLTGITAITAGPINGYARTSDGHVYAWGSNRSGQLGTGAAPDNAEHPTPALVAGVGGTGTLANVTQIAAGSSHAVALRSDHHVVAWGSQSRGQLGDGVGPGTGFSVVPVDVLLLTNITSVSADGDSSMALKGDGTVWTWGDRFPPDPYNPQPSWSTPAQVPGLAGVTTIAQGSQTSYAVVP